MDKSLFVYLVAAIEEPTVVAEQGGTMAVVTVAPKLILAGSKAAALVALGRMLTGDPTPRTRLVAINIKDTDSY